MNLPFMSNDPDSVTRESSRKRKRRKLVTDDENDALLNKTRWRTESEQQIYSSKLASALRLVRRNTSSTSSSSLSPANRSSNGRDISMTADRVLAVTGKGTTRWSRAILKMSRLSLRHKKVKKQKIKAICNCRLRIENVKKKREVSPVLQNRIKKLGRLVPGCSKIPFTNLLEEATDYIAALEMQVRAMSAIAELMWLGSFE